MYTSFSMPKSLWKKSWAPLTTVSSIPCKRVSTLPLTHSLANAKPLQISLHAYLSHSSKSTNSNQEIEHEGLSPSFGSLIPDSILFGLGEVLRGQGLSREVEEAGPPLQHVLLVLQPSLVAHGWYLLVDLGQAILVHPCFIRISWWVVGIVARAFKGEGEEKKR